MLKKLSQQRGFTLIELMITVFVVGVLSIVAVAQYQDYTIRSQVTEGFSLAEGEKPTVSDFYANHGDFPTQADIESQGGTGKFIKTTELGENGSIVATFGNESSTKITGKYIALTPKVEAANNLSWVCTSTLDRKYLPSSCDPLKINTETQSVACNTFLGNNYSYTGKVTQTRQTTTDTATGSSSSTDWQTSANSCAPAASTVSTETQTLTCNAYLGNNYNYAGQVTGTRQVTTDYTGAVTDGDWSYNNQCGSPLPMDMNFTADYGYFTFSNGTLNAIMCQYYTCSITYTGDDENGANYIYTYDGGNGRNVIHYEYTVHVNPDRTLDQTLVSSTNAFGQVYTPKLASTNIYVLGDTQADLKNNIVQNNYVDSSGNALYTAYEPYYINYTGSNDPAYAAGYAIFQQDYQISSAAAQGTPPTTEQMNTYNAAVANYVAALQTKQNNGTISDVESKYLQLVTGK